MLGGKRFGSPLLPHCATRDVCDEGCMHAQVCMSRGTGNYLGPRAKAGPVKGLLPQQSECSPSQRRSCIRIILALTWTTDTDSIEVLQAIFEVAHLF